MNYFGLEASPQKAFPTWLTPSDFFSGILRLGHKTHASIHPETSAPNNIPSSVLLKLAVDSSTRT